MAQVKEVIEWLSARDPEEIIALTGWWYQEDVEANNDVEFTPEQWDDIVERHERKVDCPIDDLVFDYLEEQAN